MMANVKKTKLADLPGNLRAARTVEAFKTALADNLYYKRGQGAPTATPKDVYIALAQTVRDYITDNWRATIESYLNEQPKFVYYLSAEYLPGRQITQNLLYAGIEDLARQALTELGYDLDALIALEPEPALGNGGLGRLAACFLDSLATLEIPSVAYGINYEFGIFAQSFRDGWQVESPDQWLSYGNPWEFPQPDNRVRVGYGGHTERYKDEDGREQVRWIPAETIMGEPAHMMVPGYQTKAVNLLRLWRAKASKEFDFQLFDVGDYTRAAEQKISSENISKVLYPNDNTPQGRELRLRQEYFFVTCSLQDILRRYLAFSQGWDELPSRVVIQINDTHPVLAIPELMRLLVDEHKLEWEQAWRLCCQVFAYTCHTLLPEALEKWPLSLFEQVLPRHLEIIYRINYNFLEEVRSHFPDDLPRLARMSIIEEWPERKVRMAYLAAVGCFSINGVAELHTNLLRRYVLQDFAEFWPKKFNNKTNGVSPRRFVKLANPRLSNLISRTIGDGWLCDLEQLRGLEPYAADQAFRQEWRQIKYANKVHLAEVIAERTGITINPDSLYDVMVKRLHEYKRQLLKALHILTLYNRLRSNPELKIQPRTFIFGAKAAPGYQAAKLIIKLINSVAEVVNSDSLVKDQLKVVFVPNFNVTLGEAIYPAAELSEQISLAGKEASGTGNMKFALNGALTIGTLDGANVEIREKVGAENFFLFGLTTDEVRVLKISGYSPMEHYYNNLELKAALDLVGSGFFSPGNRFLLRPIIDELLHNDEYMLLADYAAYIARQEEVDSVYQDQEEWARRSILNSARSGFFSSDRTIRQYCQEIWKVRAYPVK